MSGQGDTVIHVQLPAAEATEALGAQLALALTGRSGLLVFLRGDLGAGKTTLVRGWLRALGVVGPIRSPTYTLVEPYELGQGSALHLDLYRLASADEVEQLGLLDTPPDRSLWLVEWPERGGGRLPAPDLEITLSANAGGRQARITAHGNTWAAVRPALEALAAGSFGIALNTEH
jgi:tRNA threonylcarbamoyladenosine biosynthesis protein TsaE